MFYCTKSQILLPKLKDFPPKIKDFFKLLHQSGLLIRVMINPLLKSLIIVILGIIYLLSFKMFDVGLKAQYIYNIGFRVQSALNPRFEVEHSLDLEHLKASTDQVP